MLVKLGPLSVLVLVFAVPAFSQCVSTEQIAQMADGIRSGSPSNKDDKLRKELLSMKKEVLDDLRNRVQEEAALRRTSQGRSGGNSRVESFDRMMNEDRGKMASKLCEILQAKGFPRKSLVGDEASAAAFYLIKQFLPVAEQIKLVPVVNAAIDKGELAKNDDYGAFVDRLRVNVGLKQLYGTQASIRGNFLILAPIANESSVEERRAELKMGPLDDYLKYLEMLYRKPLIRERLTGPPVAIKPADKTLNQTLKPTDVKADDDVIRVDTDLVDLNVHVLSRSSKENGRDLQMSDFLVREDGHEQEVSLFNKTDAPFDLVLLLDLSGSTSGKIDLIRNATRRFIDGARSSDRLSIITFSDRTQVVCPLTADKAELVKSLDKINDIGFSYVWDGLLFALEKGFGDRPPERRRAIVMMSDGVDNSLGGRDRGSRTSFAHLAESVRTSDALVIPVYLDTFDPSYCRQSPNCESARMYATARDTLSVLSEESGGQVYYAQKIEDLDGIYQTVLADLGTIYSIGYLPTNESRDGSWRAVKVEIKGHPGLTARTRRGYYSKK